MPIASPSAAGTEARPSASPTIWPRLAPRATRRRRSASDTREWRPRIWPRVAIAARPATSAITERPCAWAATALRTDALTIGPSSRASSVPPGSASSCARRSSREAPATSRTPITVVTTPASRSSSAIGNTALGVGSLRSSGPSKRPTSTASNEPPAGGSANALASTCACVYATAGKRSPTSAPKALAKLRLATNSSGWVGSVERPWISRAPGPPPVPANVFSSPPPPRERPTKVMLSSWSTDGSAAISSTRGRPRGW